MAELKKAMRRLKAEMPKHGWKVVSYGPDNSADKSLTLRADNPKKKFSAQVELWEEPIGSKDPSLIHVSLGSTCFKAPRGQDASDEY
ncbi:MULTISPECIES: hypothetical protein [unclassified Streptomyces]|uniref:hypothetical protein n=1 Tax=unclassified Streptomyces TaxID=2593676 RepID=UPI001B381EA8|nr:MULTISPECIES: hypothetical protein [unclassified Streptomyces]MBQ0868756.1 hypothetical protein [Streptomyces sp. RK75]MBQ1125048.1 hypothetical protein [Streptomyces sp. B15]